MGTSRIPSTCPILADIAPESSLQIPTIHMQAQALVCDPRSVSISSRVRQACHRVPMVRRALVSATSPNAILRILSSARNRGDVRPALRDPRAADRFPAARISAGVAQRARRLCKVPITLASSAARAAKKLATILSARFVTTGMEFERRLNVWKLSRIAARRCHGHDAADVCRGQCRAISAVRPPLTAGKKGNLLPEGGAIGD